MNYQRIAETIQNTEESTMISTAVTTAKSAILKAIAAAKSEKARAYYRAAWGTTQRVVIVSAYTAYKSGVITRKAFNYAVQEWNNTDNSDHDLGNRVNRVSNAAAETLELAQATAGKAIEGTAEKAMDTKAVKAIEGTAEKAMELSKTAVEKVKATSTQAICKVDAEAVENAFEIAGDVAAIAQRAVLKGIGFVVSGVMPGAMPKAYTR